MSDLLIITPVRVVIIFMIHLIIFLIVKVKFSQGIDVTTFIDPVLQSSFSTSLLIYGVNVFLMGFPSEYDIPSPGIPSIPPLVVVGTIIIMLWSYTLYKNIKPAFVQRP